MKKLLMRYIFAKGGKKSLEEILVNADYSKLYTPQVRIIAHLSMWAFLSFLILLNLLLGYDYPIATSFAFMMRSLVCNSVIFYFFFYFLAPHVILKKRIFLSAFFLLLCVYIWILTDYFFMFLILNFNLIEAGSHRNAIVRKMVDFSVWEVISFRNVFANLILVLYAISPFFFIKVIFDLLRVFSRNARAERQNAQLQVDNIIVEKNFLKSQLNPHFLFNTLNGLYGLVIKKDDYAATAIMHLSEMMRYTLYECNTDKVSLKKEIGFLKNYITLEKMRYEKGRDILLTVNGSVDNLFIAPLLTFAFIENAFKYALKNKNAGFINIRIKIANNRFLFELENDKSEFSFEDKSFGGIGIKNATKRLELLYPKQHILNIEDKKTTFIVSLRLYL